MKALRQENLEQKVSINPRLLRQILFLSGIAVVYIILNIILEGRLLRVNNLRIILSHAVFPALVAWGMSFFFSTGIIDLSIGANVILSANIGCLLATTYGLGMLGLISGTVASVVLLQHLNVRGVISLGMPSWIVGLGAAMVYEAIFATYTSSRNIVALDLPRQFRFLGDMPYLGFVWVAGFIIAYILFNRTSVGLNIKALGGGANVASAMGIDEKKTVFLGALIGGIFIGFAAVVQLSYAGRIYPTSGLGSLATIFQGLACVLLAGSIGNIFSVPVGILISSFFVVSIFNVLTMLRVPSGTGQDIFLGAIVIACGILSHLKHKGVVK